MDTVTRPSERFARDAVGAVLAGYLTAIIVGGVGSRVVMRILAMINGDRAGVATEAGNIAGEITLGGTISLMFFASGFAALPGGLLYPVVRRWLPGPSVWKGLTYGALLFCLFGSIVVEKDNPDFALFGPRPLAVFLFAMLFPLYGLLLSAMAERFLSPVPAGFLNPLVTAAGYAILAGLAAFGLVRTVVAINTIL